MTSCARVDRRAGECATDVIAIPDAYGLTAKTLVRDCDNGVIRPGHRGRSDIRRVAVEAVDVRGAQDILSGSRTRPTAGGQREDTRGPVCGFGIARIVGIAVGGRGVSNPEASCIVGDVVAFLDVGLVVGTYAA